MLLCMCSQIISQKTIQLNSHCSLPINPRIQELLIVDERSQAIHHMEWNSYGLVYVLFDNNSVFNLMLP